jgi:protein involved in polysaccharide export with SLBB domain
MMAALNPLLVACLASGCGPTASEQAARAARAQAQEARQASNATEYVLEPGDKISMKFPYDPELNDSFEIRPDGRISVQLAGELRAAGQSVRLLREELLKRYTRVLKDPELSVNVESYRSRVAYVGGEVRNPGVVALATGMTVVQAIISVGGYLRSADLGNVLVIRNQGSESPQFLVVNVAAEIRSLDASEDLRMRVRDIVIVPMSGVAEAGVVVQQYINDLVPLMKSFNLNYNFGIPPAAR